MTERNLVKMSAYDHGIGFRIVGRCHKSPHQFYALRSELASLEDGRTMLASDIRSFAMFRKTRPRELKISFTCFSGACDGSGFVRGYEQDILLDYGTLVAFVKESGQEGGPKQISMLAKPYPRRRTPRLDFTSDGARETLRGITKSPMLRRRLSTALRDSFNWPDSDEIRFYSDFAPHSFFFREFRDGEAGICGGLILHDYGCPQEARYSIHT